MGEYANIKDRIKFLRTSRHMSQEDLARELGVTNVAVSQWERGVKAPKMEMREALCDFFNVNIEYLNGNWNHVSRLVSESEMRALDSGRLVSEGSVYGRYKIPVVATVACGLPLFSESNIEGYIDWDKDTDSVFAVHAKGDSMEPKIGDGYLVIVDKEAAWEDGDIVVVTVNGNDGCCKRIKKYKDSIALLSLNPAYEPMVFTDREVQSLPVVVQGKVIQVRWDL